jgi:hypothetical protein
MTTETTTAKALPRTRVYRVTSPDGTSKVVESTTRNRAISYVAKDGYKAEVMSSGDLLEAMRAGEELHSAVDDQQAEGGEAQA